MTISKTTGATSTLRSTPPARTSATPLLRHEPAYAARIDCGRDEQSASCDCHFCDPDRARDAWLDRLEDR